MENTAIMSAPTILTSIFQNPAITALFLAVSIALGAFAFSLKKKTRESVSVTNRLELEVLRLNEVVKNAEKKADLQKEAFRKFHNERVNRLKQEVLLRNKRIHKLQGELKDIKERSDADDITRNIMVLESERDALNEEIRKEAGQAGASMDAGIEVVYRLKDKITELAVQNSRLKSLNKEYERRYFDVLEFGNRIKLENRDLQQQIQELLEQRKAGGGSA